MGILDLIGGLTKKVLRLEESSENVWKLHDYSDKIDFIELDKVNSRINLPSLPLYLAGVKGLEYDSGADRFNIGRDLYSDALGVSLGSHASRHDRGGADSLNWAALSKYLNKSGSGTIGTSGSPATILEVSVEDNYYNLVPLEVDYDISGLATDETFTLTVTAVLDNGDEVTLYSASGLSAGGTLRSGDLDWSAIGDGRQIRALRVKFESSATSTSATGSATLVALEL